MDARGFEIHRKFACTTDRVMTVPAVQVLYLDLTALTTCEYTLAILHFLLFYLFVGVLKVRMLKHLQELRLCVRARQLSYALAILEDFPHHGENVDVSIVFVHWRTDFFCSDFHASLQTVDALASVVAFSLKVYIHFGGITRIRGSPVLFDDIAEYLNMCLGTWNDVGWLTLFWDICKSGIWERAARPLRVAAGWRMYLKDSIYTFN